MHATAWVKLEDITLCEINQSQKDHYCMNPLMWVTRSSQIERWKVKCWLPGALRRENGVIV